MSFLRARKKKIKKRGEGKEEVRKKNRDRVISRVKLRRKCFNEIFREKKGGGRGRRRRRRRKENKKKKKRRFEKFLDANSNDESLLSSFFNRSLESSST